MKILLNTFLLLLFQLSIGQDGTLDNTFGNSGVMQFTSINQNTRGSKILQLTNHNILIAANRDYGGATTNRSFFISQLLPNGIVDTSFGTNGEFSVSGGTGGFAYFYSMVQQEDSILMLFTLNGTVSMARIHLDGTYDLTFGNNGIIAVATGNKICLQDDGKIVIASQYYEGTDNYYYFARYSNDGQIDMSFGAGGAIYTNITPFRFDISNAICIQPDNKIIAVGTSYDSATQRHAVVVRLNENGTLDQSFNTTGVVTTDIGNVPGYAVYNEVALQTDGKIVVCGNAEYSNGPLGFGGTSPTVVRYNTDGSLDNTFGDNGKVILNTINNANDIINALRIQPDGKIIIGGSVGSNPSIQSFFYLSRLSDNGILDATFGNNGAFLTNFSTSETNYVYDIDLQENGKILAIGISKNEASGNFDAAVCRLNNDSLGRSEFDSDELIKVYPNPTSENIFISGVAFDAAISIFSTNGQRCKNVVEDDVSHLKKINLQELPSGVYFMSISQNSGKTIKKIIKS